MMSDEEDSFLELSTFDDLEEPIPAPQIFCDGIGPITIADGLIHVTFWANQQSTDGNGFRRVIVARCISPTSAAHQSVKLAGRVLASNMLDVIKKRTE